MRVATLLSAVAIVALTTMSTALAYGPSASSPSLSQSSGEPKTVSSDVGTGQVRLAFAVVKKIATTPGYLLIKNDPGSARPYPNCEASGKCETGTLEMLLSRHGSATVEFNCRDVGGCAIVGGR